MEPGGRKDESIPELFAAKRWRELSLALGLPPRQQQVARLICLGRPKNAIARELSISEPTVRMHADGLYKRLGVHSRLGLAIRLVLAERKLSERAGRATET